MSLYTSFTDLPRIANSTDNSSLFQLFAQRFSKTVYNKINNIYFAENMKT